MTLTKDTPIRELLRSNDELTHYGIRGMKWGVRRYQNKDGILTLKGRERYRDTKTSNSDDIDGDRNYRDENRYLIVSKKVDFNTCIEDLPQPPIERGRKAIQSMPEIFDWDPADYGDRSQYPSRHGHKGEQSMFEMFDWDIEDFRRGDSKK